MWNYQIRISIWDNHFFPSDWKILFLLSKYTRHLAAFPNLRHFPLYSVKDRVKSWLISSDAVPIFHACRFIINFQSHANNCQKDLFTSGRGLLTWLQPSQFLSFFFMSWNQCSLSTVTNSCLTPPSLSDRQKIQCNYILSVLQNW